MEEKRREDCTIALAIPSSSTRKNEIIMYHMLLRCLNKLQSPSDHRIKMHTPAVNPLLCTKLEEEVIAEMDISENRFREEIKFPIRATHHSFDLPSAHRLEKPTFSQYSLKYK